jgi:hypothetical protein
MERIYGDEGRIFQYSMIPKFHDSRIIPQFGILEFWNPGIPCKSPEFN